ncbi:MAG: phosphopantothenoylcysteine decarboxylase [Puniceicoccales bacterium]|jgi:phosphopantothenoylcysteine decarboxylase/phosphopantothenate--cysteine ligase|nr:phosphopantothenoylcysteine decarboxylase [Puniceicoccales bacterium]
MSRFLITAGATREFFDPVRFISNPSSGKMGFALAAAAQLAGHTVELVHGPVSLPVPVGVHAHAVVTGAEMLACAGKLFPHCDILIMTAAVCDFRPKHYSADKVKKENASLVVEFERTPDILKTLSAQKTAAQTLVGFAAETQDIENYARRKLEEKNLDFIAANQVGGTGAENAFGSDTNRLILLGKNSFRLEYGPAPKSEIARWLVAEILARVAA